MFAANIPNKITSAYDKHSPTNRGEVHKRMILDTKQSDAKRSTGNLIDPVLRISQVTQELEIGSVSVLDFTEASWQVSI